MRKIINSSQDIIHELLALPLLQESKSDSSPVTIIDRTVEKHIREELKKHFPEDGIIGEEFAAHQPDAARQWVIDPIDGTRAMIGGFPTYTTLIALLEDNRPIASAMLQAVTGETWIGQLPSESSSQTECLFNDSPTHCRKEVNMLSEACFATTSTLLVDEQDKPLIESMMREAKLYQLGGDGYAYGKLASGTVDLVVESGMQPYDFLPLIPIVVGSGGVMTDWQGKELTLHSKGQVVAASSESLHKAILQKIKEHQNG